jgi:hypothetical protein
MLHPLIAYLYLRLLQVAYDQRGEVTAVRYEVEAVAPKQPTEGGYG